MDKKNFIVKKKYDDIKFLHEVKLWENVNNITIGGRFFRGWFSDKIPQPTIMVYKNKNDNKEKYDNSTNFIP